MSYITNISVISVLYILLNVYLLDLNSDKLKLNRINIYFCLFIRIKFYLFVVINRVKKNFMLILSMNLIIYSCLDCAKRPAGVKSQNNVWEIIIRTIK